MNNHKIKKIAIFASGNGTNAQRISEYFLNHKNIKVNCILTNNPNAHVIKRAEKLKIKCLIFTKSDLYETHKIINYLKENNINLIVLAGFLWIIPKNLILSFKNKIINIHPALLPKYGGKGMFGNNVHKTIIENNEKQSGITIHHVNEKYDQGKIIFQKKCKILSSDTIQTLANKIHKLEYKYYPLTIKKILK